MSGKKKKRRFWSDDEKRMIVAQCAQPGVSVSQVARRYDVNANLVFRWRRDARLSVPPDNLETAEFLPVMLAQDASVIEQEAALSSTEGRIRICLACGHSVEISGEFDAQSVMMLLKGLGA